VLSTRIIITYCAQGSLISVQICAHLLVLRPRCEDPDLNALVLMSRDEAN
jgi:hypothetical protein